MEKEIVASIRILPNDKGTFSNESEFKHFIEDTMIARGGDYYFPNSMMNCPRNTLVLFQYDGMIRAFGLLIDLGKKTVFDECGEIYAGFYKFDTETLTYANQELKSLKTIAAAMVANTWNKRPALERTKEAVWM